MRPIQPIRTLLPALLLLILWPGAPAIAQEAGPDEVLSAFKVNGDFMFVLGGESRKDAEIFFSQRAVAYLVIAKELSSPLLINVRSRSIESVDLEKVLRNDDGTVDIQADAELATLGSFMLKEKQVAFTVDGKEARLKPKPWLLGRHPGSRLKEYNPEYALLASQYAPSAEDVAALKSQSRDVRVRVYFGSWCPHCKQMVPRILRVADELDGSKIKFEYYGLSKPLGQDPETRKAGVVRVPTVIVYVDGQEVHRLDGNELQTPEKALQATLQGLPGTAGSSGP